MRRTLLFDSWGGCLPDTQGVSQGQMVAFNLSSVMERVKTTTTCHGKSSVETRRLRSSVALQLGTVEDVRLVDLPNVPMEKGAMKVEEGEEEG